MNHTQASYPELSSFNLLALKSNIDSLGLHQCLKVSAAAGSHNPIMLTDTMLLTAQ